LVRIVAPEASGRAKREVFMLPIRLLSLRAVRYAFVGVLAFALGSVSVAAAAGSGAVQLPSFRLGDGTNPDRYATVDTGGNLHVSVSNQPSSQSVTGAVSVTNFPTTQQVSGTVSVAAPTGRVILLAENFTAPENNGNATPRVDTSDCRSLTAMVRGPGSASDVSVKLVQENPDNSGFGVVSGTTAGIATYFTVGGVPLVTPRAGVSVESNLDHALTLEKVWLFCGR
jgi:hypothetical protein